MSNIVEKKSLLLPSVLLLSADVSLGVQEEPNRVRVWITAVAAVQLGGGCPGATSWYFCRCRRTSLELQFFAVDFVEVP